MHVHARLDRVILLSVHANGGFGIYDQLRIILDWGTLRV